MEDIRVCEVNLTEEFLDVDFPEIEISASSGISACCSVGEPV